MYGKKFFAGHLRFHGSKQHLLSHQSVNFGASGGADVAGAGL